MVDLTSPPLDTSEGDETRAIGLRARFKRWMGIKPALTLHQRIAAQLRMRGGAKGDMSTEERHMLMNVLNFGGLRVDDVMVPRADIVAIDVKASLEDILEECRKSSHSRMPIFRDTLDEPIGMVHIKDVLDWIGQVPPQDTFSLEKIRRDVLFVPPSMPALDLLLKMQSTRRHLALVIDEYGGTDGLVSIEDLIEPIVGEIEDEHDAKEGPALKRRSDGNVNADARAQIEELEDLLGMKLRDNIEDDEIETLGGLVFSLVGRVPQRGELIAHPVGIEFEVKDADPRRIKRLIVHLPLTKELAKPSEPLPAINAKSTPPKISPPVKGDKVKANTSGDS
ncbi:MAG: hemolysin family protein [Parvibaculaceae bacterium]|jgi:magnesium and cobalt transporter|nr:hemolysin family protein [Parvibaculaceae bacterium]